MRIISASYRTDDTKVELFGRCDDGRSATVICGGFDPYIDVIEPSDAELAGIKKNTEFKRIEDKTLWYDGKERRSSRIYIKHPFKVPEIRTLFLSKVMSADIPFHHRFIYDLDLGSCVEVEGEPNEERRYSSDIVIETSIGRIKNCDDFNPELKILSFDIACSLVVISLHCFCDQCCILFAYKTTIFLGIFSTSSFPSPSNSMAT